MFRSVHAGSQDLDFGNRVVSTSRLGLDQSVFRDVVVRKPWGCEYLICDTDAVAVWMLHIGMGHHTSFHAHPRKATSLVVLDGRVRVKTFDQTFLLGPCDGVTLDAGVFHQTFSLSPGGSTLIEIETPNDKFDLVRLRDAYGRKDAAYEGSADYEPRNEMFPHIDLGCNSSFETVSRAYGPSVVSIVRSEPERLSALLDSFTATAHVLLLQGQGLSSNSSWPVATSMAPAAAIEHARRFQCSIDFLVIDTAVSAETGAQRLASIMGSSGIDAVFSALGDANSYLVRAFEDLPAVRVQSHFDEDSAVHAALGYAKLTGDAATVVIGSGVSGPRSLPGVASAWTDSTPLIVLAGQTRSDHIAEGGLRQMGAKSLPMGAVVAPLVKAFTRVSANRFDVASVQASIVAATDCRPGPVWIEVPIDVQTRKFETLPGATMHPGQHHLETQAHSVDYEWLAGVLRDSQRPIILGGAGVRSARAQDALIELAEYANIPLQVTRSAMDLVPDNHALFAGRPGGYGQRSANFAIQNSDLVLVLGASLSLSLVGREPDSFARGAVKIVVDIDQHELEKYPKDYVTIQADVGTFIDCVLKHDLASRGHTRQVWVETCHQWQASFPAMGEHGIVAVPAGPYQAVRAISEKLPEGAVVSIEGGPVLHIANQVFVVKKGQRILSATGLEARGFAVAGSVGAVLSQTHAGPYVAICDREGFLNSFNALRVIYSQNLPVVVYVVNTTEGAGPSGIDRIVYPGTDGEVPVSGTEPSELARAVGISFSISSDASEWPAVIEHALSGTMPVMVQLNVDATQALVPRPGYTRNEWGEWVPRPIEDMDPPLARDVLASNMRLPLWEA